MAVRTDTLTDLILEIFRLNGRLLAAGDALVGGIGLTSARWQVLGAIALHEAAPTVAQLARAMGLARQSVQRIVNELAAEGVVTLIDNPDHKRAKRLWFTAKGSALYGRALAMQAPWAERLAKAARKEDLDRALDTLRALRARLEKMEDAP